MNFLPIFNLLLLGGPLIRQSDGALMGISSSSKSQTSGFIFKSSDHVLNAFTNIHYYFKWIKEKTRLDLPFCVYHLV